MKLFENKEYFLNLQKPIKSVINQIRHRKIKIEIS